MNTYRIFHGDALTMLRTLPEYMAVLPSSWLVVSLVWGQISNRARSLAPPPVLPDPGPLRQRR